MTTRLVDQIGMPDPSLILRPELTEKEASWNFRVYKDEPETEKMKGVYQTYKKMHTNMTMDYVKQREEHWCKFNHLKSTMMNALELLHNIIDESDPDTELPNIIHAFQTAEGIRKAYPDLDWLHLTGLIHDLGKIMALYCEPQWSTVGDTFPLGCQFAPSIVLRDSTFNDNPDLKNEKFSSECGIYSPNCGLDNVKMSWGHDEYLYRVLQENNCKLPEEAMYIIRYHSFYPWHSGGDYMHLCNEKDMEMLSWVKKFQKFDLYTKSPEVLDVEALKPYYQGLIDKYCPGELKW